MTIMGDEAVESSGNSQGSRPASGGLSWTSHPVRDDPGWKSGGLVLAISGFSVGVYFSLESLVLSFVSFTILGSSMSRYFFPVRYSLTEQEVAVKHAGWTRRIPWERFRNHYVHREGVFLTPFGVPSRLDAFRGCFLRFKDNRNEVLDFVDCSIQGGRD